MYSTNLQSTKLKFAKIDRGILIRSGSGEIFQKKISGGCLLGTEE